MKRLQIFGLSCLVSAALVAQPKGMQVHAGHAEQSVKDSKLTITSAGNTIIKWDDFSVNSHETVKFDQMAKNSAVLNRVVGGEKSFIYGKIESNGKVYLTNGAGIYIGPNAAIKTAGFLASTGAIRDDEFLSGGDLTITDFGKGTIQNLGTIETKNGDVTLVARRTVNTGKLNAPEDHVNIASGVEVLIKPDGPERIFIKPGKDSPTGQMRQAIDNYGEINAFVAELKTNSNPYAHAICNGGKIQATKIANQGGKILLVAESGKVDVHGQLIAPSGKVVATGKSSTAVHDSATIDVSDNHRPGKAFIGGSFRGKDESVVHSELTVVKKGAVINADAKEKGNGGQVVVWSNGGLTWDSEISARALKEGVGGMVEVSSKGTDGLINGTPLVSGTTENGKTLFDPKFARIQNNGTDPATGNTFGNNPSGSVIITGAAVSTALESGALTIQANTDIVVADNIAPASGNNGLSLEAGRSVEVTESATITLDAAPFAVIINDENCVGGDRDAGVATFRLGGATSVNTQGGNIDVTVGTFGGSQKGVVMVDGATLSAAGGNITVEGFGADTPNNNKGIVLTSGASVTTSGAGTIALNGRGSVDSVSNASGVYTSSATSVPVTITTENGTLNITGVAGGDGTGNNNTGCTLNNAFVSSTGTGVVTVTGTGGAGVNNNIGVLVTGQGTNIASTTGAVSIVGNGAGSGEFNYGVRVDSGARVSSTGAATVGIDGTGGDGTACNIGVILSGKYTNVSSTGGGITITGTAQGFGNYNQGIRAESYAAITATNAAAIDATGTAAPGRYYDNGIFVSGQGTTITSVDGDIILTGTGQGGGNSNKGIVIQYRGNVEATGTGTVTENSTP